MNKSELLLIALAAGEKFEHTPVQVQKLMFLIEDNVGGQIGGPLFEFMPYDYGPFDSSIYDLLRELESDGLLSSSVSNRGWKKYAVTDEGMKTARTISEKLDHNVISYINRASKFVRELSFSQLVSAIYKAYPDMKANSVFRG